MTLEHAIEYSEVPPQRISITPEGRRCIGPGVWRMIAFPIWRQTLLCLHHKNRAAPKGNSLILTGLGIRLAHP